MHHCRNPYETAVLSALTKFCIAEIALGADVGEDWRIAVKIFVGARDICFMTAGIIERRNEHNCF
jgi:hypothetical protein